MKKALIHSLQILMLVTLATVASQAYSVPSGAKTFSKVEDMSSWGNCTKCAGAGGNAYYTISQHQSSPSKDGSSMKIFLGGSTPFSHSLLWRRMGSSTSATHFILDMNYYIDNPSNSQGLEFAA